MVAVRTATPEIMLDNAESKLLADAIGAVQEHYGFDFSPDTAIWVNLVTALGTVYGPRAVTIYARKKKEGLEKQRARNVPGPTANQREEVNKTVEGIFSIPGMHAPTSGGGFFG